jgi:hypothetical protein
MIFKGKVEKRNLIKKENRSNGIKTCTKKALLGLFNLKLLF